MSTDKEPREEAATAEELEKAVNDLLNDMFRESKTFKALKKYRPLVQNLTLEEYAGLRAAVEEDRPRRMAQVLTQYPFTANLKEAPDVDD